VAEVAEAATEKKKESTAEISKAGKRGCWIERKRGKRGEERRRLQQPPLPFSPQKQQEMHKKRRSTQWRGNGADAEEEEINQDI
jgi:hypothetical protein